MAASVSDMKMHKRRINELDDITNNHSKKAKVNVKGLYVQQQRSPSPTDNYQTTPDKESTICDKLKSVSFEVDRNDYPYQGSPLLTPKDEDDESDAMLLSTAHTTPISPDDSSFDKINGVSQDGIVDGVYNLNDNADYTGLTSSLRLLQNSKKQIVQDIDRLKDLSQSIDLNDKEQLVSFYMKLINNEMDLPKQHSIVKSPVVNWSRYHNGLKSSNDVMKLSEKPLFRKLNVFKK